MKNVFSNVAMVLLSLNLAGQTASAATVESARCADSGDSLDGPQAAARTKWAFKCYPDLRGMMKNKEVTLRDTATGAVFPGYPTFARVDDDGNVISYWKAPVDETASCDGAKQYSFVGACRAGCYTPDSLLLFSTGFVQIGEAHKQLREDIVTLTRDSSLENIQLATSTLHSYTVDPKEKTQPILIIKTADAGELKVTLNHPLVDSSGVMRSANTLRVGEKLVKMDGHFDEIVSIQEVKYTGKVYNVQPLSSAPEDNIVVAQGFLNGSVYFQNEGVKELNRAALRSGRIIPDSLVQ